MKLTIAPVSRSGRPSAVEGRRQGGHLDRRRRVAGQRHGALPEAEARCEGWVKMIGTQGDQRF